MRRLWSASVLALVVLLQGVLMVMPSPAAEGGYSIERRDYIVNTRFGKIYVQVAHPVNDQGDIVKGPAIFTYSPYSVLGAPPNFRRNNDANHWVPQGYNRVWADVIGTGNSGGCYDYGGKREKVTGHRLVEWIAHQDWSTGKVAMIGGSYEGTTATATAITDPPHLTTIVPEAAISRWYDYAYSGGIRYFINNENPSDEGIDTPLAFDFGLAIPPPTDADDPAWADRVESTVTPCDEITHTRHGYDDTPDYGPFWRQRDYIIHAGNIDIPVLIAANWGDWNVKQVESIKLYRSLTHAPTFKLYMGTRWEGHGTPGGEYDQTVDRWMDHYLMGAHNGIQNLAKVTSQMSDRDGPIDWYSGRWPDTTKVKLYARRHDKAPYPWKLRLRRPRFKPTRATAAEFFSDNSNTEADANTEPRADTHWLWFETKPLARDVRIFGNPRVRIYSTVQRRWITFTPTVVDYTVTPNPHGPVSATRGWLDSRYRHGLYEREPVTPGKPFRMKVVEKPQDYTFRKGHRIGLNIQTEINEWSVPKQYPNCDSPACQTVRINWESGKTRLILPVVDAPRHLRRLFHS